MKATGDRFIKDDGLFLPEGVSPETATAKQLKDAREAYARDYWNLQHQR